MKINRILPVLSSITLCLLLVIVILKIFFIDSRMVTSGSMTDTLKHGDYVFSWKRPQGLQRGQIILFRLPGERETLIKRIIGLPGDTVKIAGERIFINGVYLEERYVREPAGGSDVQIHTVLPDNLFVLGDSRRGSRDSRVFGFVRKSTVTGRVLCIYYPFSRWRWF